MTRNRTACVVLLLPLITALLPGQSFREARSQFRKAVRQGDTAAREEAVDAVVAAADPGGIDLLLGAVRDADRDLEVLSREIERTGARLQEIWENIDRQMAAGRGVRQGSLEVPRRKHRQVQEQLRELTDRQDALEAWRDTLEAGAARLINALPPGPRAETVLAFEEEVKEAGAPGPARSRLRILSRVEARVARDVLVGVLSRSQSAGLRAAAVDLLARRGDPDVVEALARGLEDEAWNVQVASVRALGDLPSLAGVPHLVDAMAGAKGRVLEEIIEALEDLSGITYHANPVLWKEWWEENGEKLSAVVSGVDAEEDAARRRAMQQVRRRGLLAGVHAALRRHGMGPHTAAGRGRAAAPPEGADWELLLQTVPAAIGSRPEEIRGRTLSRLLLDPFEASRDHAERRRYLQLMAPVPHEDVLEVLRRYAGPDPLGDPGGGLLPEEQRERLRTLALEGLGNQEDPLAVPPLRDALEDYNAGVERKLLAVRMLGRLALPEAVEALIGGLDARREEVAAAAYETLKEITGEDHGREITPWRSWWSEAKEGFEPPGKDGKDKEAADKGGTGTSFYGIDTRSLHLLYVLDVSGSMQQKDAGDGVPRIQVAKRELMQSISSLSKDATFNIIFYNHRYQVWQKRMVKAEPRAKAAARRWIEQVEAQGNTNIFDPLETAFRLAGRGTHDKKYGIVLDTIFFLSDGRPNRGRIIDPVEIVKEVKRLNALKKVKIHTIGVGDGHDGDFMEELAAITGGTYVSYPR